MVQGMLEAGPGLIGLFVPEQALEARAKDYGSAPWREPLRKLLERSASRPRPALSRQETLFEQTTGVLLALARRRPLLLLLDDLQWADSGSVSLLFHLGRRLAGSRILVLAAYRPEEVTAGRGEERHALESVVNELSRASGEGAVDLSLTDGRCFVEELVDAEPNRLGQQFRERLYHHTSGHALATVEILRELTERGDLRKDEENRWVEGPELDWEKLPTRVEAVIAERIGRLPQEQQALLAVASVEGEEFTAEVAAQVLGIDVRAAVRTLSASLAREHRLVAARGLERVGDRSISRYRFCHYLFGLYLYRRMDDVERVHLHRAVGETLESLYGERARSEKAVEMARHFESAGMAARAVEYRLQAGNEALRLCGWKEARGQFERGLSLLETLPDSPDRDRQEVDLQLALGSALLATDGFGSRGQIAAYSRAYDLSRKLGARVQLWPALHALANSSTARGNYPRALELSEQLLDLAQRFGEPWLLALAHFTLGSTLFSSGISLVRSREHLEQAILFYEREPDPDRLRFLTSLNGFDVDVNSRAWLSTVLWILGYPDQATKRAREAVALAQQLNHLLSLVLALYAAGHAYQHRHEDRALREAVQQIQGLVSGKQLLVGDVWVQVFGGWLAARTGQVDEGLRRIREGTTAWQGTGAIFGTTAQLIILTETCLLGGQIEEGLQVVDRGLALVERTGARPNEADLYWLRGELLLARGGDPLEAEAWFRKAMEVAREQEARSYELRAATSLAKLWAGQGKQQEARELLDPVYSWFTEGFDTPDLVDATKLLAEL
jgi:tetratricopeptide (TPR) repeat protein